MLSKEIRMAAYKKAKLTVKHVLLLKQEKKYY